MQPLIELSVSTIRMDTQKTTSKFFNHCVHCFAGGRYCHCTDDDNIGTRTCHWFQQTIHVAGHFDHGQEAAPEGRNVQFSESAVERDLGEWRDFYRVAHKKSLMTKSCILSVGEFLSCRPRHSFHALSDCWRPFATNIVHRGHAPKKCFVSSCSLSWTTGIWGLRRPFISYCLFSLYSLSATSWLNPTLAGILRNFNRTLVAIAYIVIVFRCASSSVISASALYCTSWAGSRQVNGNQYK